MFMRITIKFLVVATACFMGVAHADQQVTNEAELNNPIDSAQGVPMNAEGAIVPNASLGNIPYNFSEDYDFFKFYANKGDTYSIDIDGGASGAAAADTQIAVFSGDSAHEILRWNDNVDEVDPGSVNTLDPRIDNFVADKSGYYFVVVANANRIIEDGGNVTSGQMQQADYTLVISPSTKSVKQIAIRVRPGEGSSAKPINPKSRGKIPVAILGGKDFSPLNIDLDTLTFGSTGSEKSLVNCNMNGVDLNHDGIVDLICHFDNQAAKFKVTDGEAKIRGETTGANGVAFEGTGYLKVRPAKRMP